MILKLMYIGLISEVGVRLLNFNEYRYCSKAFSTHGWWYDVDFLGIQ